MSDPFIGEIRMFGGTFAPMDWAFCDGQIMNISQNDTLFALIGKTYGGDGIYTFGLPDLRGRVPMHRSTPTNDYPIGAMAGAETVTPAANQVGAHTHPVRANTAVGTQTDPTNAFWAAPATARYSANPPSLEMRSTLVGNTGGTQSHENMMPFLVVNFIIALAGIYPAQE